MNHFKISIFKSLIRIIGCIIGIILTVFNNIDSGAIVTFSCLGVAEILGILEELFDKRKEN